MKIARLQVENFRHLGGQGQPLVLDFTDALGRVRDFTLLVGPNTCGKTTILDSIAAAMGPSLQMPTLRPHFQRTPRTVVRRGALHARVTCWLQFTPEEIAATRELFKLAERPENVPDTPEVELTWEYPDPAGELDRGFSRRLPRLGWTLLKGRFQVARLLATGRVGWSWFGRVGGVFTFDQQRTGFGKTVSRRVGISFMGPRIPQLNLNNEERATHEPSSLILRYALSCRPRTTGRRTISDSSRRNMLSSAPHRIVGPIRDDELGGLDLRFSDGHNEYSYSGLSSGEQMMLLLLIRFVAEHMHQSIVLIDEMELNQHPIWQRKLLHLIPRMGEGNQIIATTHSPYLRDAVRPDAVIDLGDLDEGRTTEPA